MVTVESEPVVKQEPQIKQEDGNFKIATQIEYYFSDVNLRKDKFLRDEMAKNEDGWVPIDTLLTFNRLKVLAQDKETVVTALNSSFPELEHTVEVNEDGTMVKRRVPFVEMTEEQVAELNRRTIHFKGISQDATLEEIRGFCAQYGKVISVEMRRFRDDRKFKGCVMCVYSTQDEADKALIGTEVYDENIKFQRENKVSWQERKDKYAEERKNKKKMKKGEDGTAAVTGDAKSEEEKVDVDPVKVKSTIIVLEGVSASIKYDTIKSFFKEHGSVAYVDTDAETQRAYIRFHKENEAVSVLKSASISIKKEEEEAVQETESVVKVKEEPAAGENGDEEENKSAASAPEAAGIKSEPCDADAAVVESENGSDAVLIEIKGQKYKAFVLTGEDEVAHWISVNKIRKEKQHNTQKGNHGSGFQKRGKGFRRGGSGYKGRNRNDNSGDKRRSRHEAASGDAAAGDATGNKRIKLEG